MKKFKTTRSLGIFRALAILFTLSLFVCTATAAINHNVPQIIECGLLGVGSFATLITTVIKAEHPRLHINTPLCLRQAIPFNGGANVQQATNYYGGITSVNQPTPLPSYLAGNDTNAVGVNGINYPGLNIVPSYLASGKLTWSFTTASGYTDGTLFQIFPQFIDDSAPSNITFSGPGGATWSQWAHYVGAGGVAILLGKVVITTDQSINFQHAVRATVTTPLMQSVQYNDTWDTLAKDASNVDQTVRIIGNSGWVIGHPSIKLQVGMLAFATNVSTLTFSADIIRVAVGRTMMPFSSAALIS